METPDWITDGVCTSKPHLTHLFFSDDRAEQDQAKAMCDVCPVKAWCAVYALERREKFGIWGGLSPADRRRIQAR